MKNTVQQLCGIMTLKLNDMKANMIFIALLKKESIILPQTEFRFHHKRKWRFDYAWQSHKIAVEVEGGVFGRGKTCPVCKQAKRLGHSSVTGIKRDIEKYNNAMLLGWRVYRVLPEALCSMKTLAVLKQLLK